MNWLSKLVDRASDFFCASQRFFTVGRHPDDNPQFFYGAFCPAKFFHVHQFLFASRTHRGDLRHDAGLGVVVPSPCGRGLG